MIRVPLLALLALTAVAVPAGAGVVDTTPPLTRFTDGPRGSYMVDGRRFHTTYEFRANEPATFECKLDRKPRYDCASPQAVTFPTTADWHRHIFRVWATDAAGNRQPEAQVRRFELRRAP